MWQIAQRDYKFGKGKHSSLTKATYDAVGNKFRSMWGKEAGWAHSVLFTADLRAFSERLVPKVEKLESIVKKEFSEDEGDAKKTIIRVRREVLLTPSIKRESEEAEDTKYDDMMSRVKRRRKGKA